MDRPQTITAKGYGAALALPIWCQVMAKASPQRYPSKEFQPPEPLKRVRVCRFSNELATDGCQEAGTSYLIDLPVSRIPRLVCTAHPGVAQLTGQGQPTLAPGETPPPPTPSQPGRLSEALPAFVPQAVRGLNSPGRSAFSSKPFPVCGLRISSILAEESVYKKAGGE